MDNPTLQISKNNEFYIIFIFNHLSNHLGEKYLNRYLTIKRSLILMNLKLKSLLKYPGKLSKYFLNLVFSTNFQKWPGQTSKQSPAGTRKQLKDLKRNQPVSDKPATGSDKYPSNNSSRSSTYIHSPNTSPPMTPGNVKLAPIFIDLTFSINITYLPNPDAKWC